MKENRKCLVCEDYFLIIRSNQKNSKYCSIKCRALSQTLPRIKIECLTCKKIFNAKPYHARKGYKHCSLKCRRPKGNKYKEQALKRFHASYEVDENGCWKWKKSTSSKGYGRFLLGKQKLPAHRAAYILFKGEIPKGLLCCHRCDQRDCVNPYHIFLGTNVDNMRDMTTKGRQNNGKSPLRTHERLNIEKVIHIKKLLKDGYSVRKITQLMSLPEKCMSSIYRIKQNRSWAHIKIN